MKYRTSVTMLAAEVFGARAALVWLETPNEALGGKKPIEVWDDPESARTIERILWRIKDPPKLPY